MPKLFGREMPWTILGPASALGLYVIYSMLFPASEEARSFAPKKKTTKSSAASTLYTKEDRTARFAVMTEPLKDAFHPLVVKTTGPKVPLDENGMPVVPPGIGAAFSDGESGWGYTGYVVLNGRPQGLLENPSKGQALYVQKGDVWKHSTIVELTPEKIVLKGPAGTQTAKLGEISEPKAATSVDANGVAPVNPAPALRGAIGAGLPGVQANGAPGTPGADANVGNNNPFNDLSVQPDQGFGRRGRGRRNRGGG